MSEVAIKDGHFIDAKTGESIPIRFGDASQTALLKRLTDAAEKPLNIGADYERMYHAGCDWVCPKCGRENSDETEPEHYSEQDAIEALARWKHECGCGAEFKFIEKNGEYFLEESK